MRKHGTPPHEPNSRRYWRMNSIAALRATDYPTPAPDPEAMARRQSDRAELAQLEARETAVRARAARMAAARQGKPATPQP